MKKDENSSSGFMDVIGFIAASFNIYTVNNGRFSESGGEGWTHVLFSRDFLRTRRWSVFPLWEGDIRRLKKEDGSGIDFLARVCSFCKKIDDKFLYVAMLEKTEWAYSKNFSALTVAARELNLLEENPSLLFEASPDNLPYWGGGFMWPSSKKFAVYFDGDNVSAIAGDNNEIERLLGVPYVYCKKRFIEMNVAHKTTPGLVDAYVRFCEEFRE